MPDIACTNFDDDQLRVLEWRGSNFAIPS